MRGATFTGAFLLISVPVVVTKYFASMFGRSHAGMLPHRHGTLRQDCQEHSGKQAKSTIPSAHGAES